MKRVLSIVAMMLLVLGLAACGDDTNNKDSNNNNQGEEQQNNNNENETANEDENANNDENDGEAAGSDEDFTDNEKFNEVLSLLTENGIEITNVTAGYDDVNGSVDSMTAVVGGEDMLTLEIAELEAGHENLEMAAEEEQVIINFEGQEGPIEAFTVGGTLVFMFSENHPNYDEVRNLIETKYEAN